MSIEELDQKAVIDFLDGTDIQKQEIVKRLARIILSVDKELNMAIKWNRLTIVIKEFHHWICGINITKRNVGLIFHFGGLMDDKYQVLKAGTSKFLRKIEIEKVDDINEEIIRDLVIQALSKVEYFKNNWKEINKRCGY